MRLASVTNKDAIMDLLSETDIFCDICNKTQLTQHPKGWIWLYEAPLLHDDDPALLICPLCKKNISQ